MGKLTESQENEKEVVKYLQRKKSLPTEGWKAPSLCRIDIFLLWADIPLLSFFL